MSAAPVPRWAVSFADLLLLLLGCFVLLHAMESARPKAAAGAGRTADRARGATFAAAELFLPGEAVLRPGAEQRLAALGRSLAGRPVAIVSRGGEEGGRRLDRFELGAARAAAVGRVLRRAGVAERDLDVQLAAGSGTAQSIAIAAR